MAEVEELLKKMEERIIKKIEGSGKNYRCAFTEVFQEYLKCIHDVNAKEYMSRKDLIEILDASIIQMSRFIDMLKQEKSDDALS